jgi:DNA-binding response OmpR family regulator
MNPHILFVDDEAPIRELLSLFFRKKGFSVTTAITLSEAKDLARDTQFSLAIVDVNLAGESGLDLLGFFRANYPAMPVVIFTGMTGDETLVAKAMSAGASGFMQKTDPLPKLFAEVTRHLTAPARSV